MEKLIDDEYKITIIGNLIRDERKVQKKSASVIASLSGISQQFLSELERGKKSLPYSTVHSVFNVLNIHFDPDIELIRRADDLINNIINAYMNFDRDSMLSTLELLICNTYRYSYAYDYYQTAILLKDIFIKRADKPVFIRHFKKPKLEMLNLICLEKTDSKNTMFYITQGLSYHSSTHTQPSYCGLYCILLFDLAEYHEKNNDLFKALSAYKAVIQAASANYFRRFSLSAELAYAITYSKLGDISLSQEYLERIISVAQPDDDIEKQIRYAAVINSATNFLIMGDYNKCQATAISLFNANISETNYNFVCYQLAFSNYMLGNTDEALTYCRHYKLSDNDHSFPADFIRMLISLKSDTPNQQMLIDLFSTALLNGDSSDVEVSFKLLTDVLKKNKDFAKAVEYYDKYIQYRFSKRI